MKRFEKRSDAKKELKRLQADPKNRFRELTIFDMRKTHPRMVKRYLVGDRFDYLSL